FHPQQIPNLYFAGRAFLLFLRGRSSRQGNHPRLVCFDGHSHGSCEVEGMTHPCADCSTLSIGDIHVWTARFVNDHHLTTDLLRILDQEERARAVRLSFERDRVRFIQAHGIVRQILANYSRSDAAALTFARNPHGKPYLVPPSNSPNLQFSVSHSGNCCMLAVRLDHSVGVDVEKMHDLPQGIAIARRYFTPAESRALAALQGRA